HILDMSPSIIPSIPDMVLSSFIFCIIMRIILFRISGLFIIFSIIVFIMVESCIISMLSFWVSCCWAWAGWAKNRVTASMVNVSSRVIMFTFGWFIFIIGNRQML